MTDAAEELRAAHAAVDAAQAALAKAQADAAAAAAPSTSSGSEGPLSAEAIAAITAGYAFQGEVLEIGAVVNGVAIPAAQVRIPVAMLNRHGLVAGATGTGKTRTLAGAHRAAFGARGARICRGHQG